MQLPVAWFHCWNDNIDPKEKFLLLQGILSCFGPVAHRSCGRAARFVTKDRSLPEIDDPFCADDHLQTAAAATAKTMTPASKAIESRAPSSSR